MPGSHSFKINNLREWIDGCTDHRYNLGQMKPTKGLILYRRHAAGCGVHSKKLSTAQKRFWPDCSCPVWIFGNMPNGDRVPRQSTGFNDIKQAEAFRVSKMAEHTQTLAG